MEPKILSLLKPYKKSNTAVFLGCGMSIRDITKEQWDKIKTFDTWAINNFIYHPSFVPNFYHVELKTYDYEIFQRRLKQKKNQYLATKFIFPSKAVMKQYGNKRLAQLVRMPFVFEYDFTPRDPKRLKIGLTANDFKNTTNTDARYKFNDNLITKSYNISLTCVLEIMYRMGYANIIMFGVDLQNSYYFWTGKDPIYGEVHHQTNKEHHGKNPELPHNTVIVSGFIKDFGHRMAQKNAHLFIGHKKTLLYPDVPYKDIMEF